MRHVGLHLALGILLTGSQSLAGSVADFATDFSTTNNPNSVAYGTWSYNDGAAPLPTYIANWAGSSGLSGWGPTANTGGDFLPFFTQVTSANVSSTWANQAAVGDVIIHDWDSSNGDGNGQANVTWTSPSAMVATVSGQVWSPATTSTGREQEYELILNPGPSQTVLVPLTPIIELTDTFSNPLTFSFSNVSLNSSDVVQLQVQEDPSSPFGNFTGVNLTISSAPEPASLGLMIFTCLGALAQRSRRG